MAVRYGLTSLSRRAITPRCRRAFHTTRRLDVVKPFMLADIGEGIRECQIIQWFVQPGARVEQFDKLCEVQSDKAATDITSPFDGVVKRLFYEPDDMATVGKPLLEIDIQSDISPEDEAQLGSPPSTDVASTEDAIVQAEDPVPCTSTARSHASLATPAVRHMLRQQNLDIASVQGSGRDGRVTKEDVQRHVAQLQPQTQAKPSQTTRKALTPVQSAMFKTMTRSLSIPHFLYSVDVDMSAMTALRRQSNHLRASEDRLTPLPFIIKAMSMSITHHPLLNASLHTGTPKPELSYNPTHDFGIAVDTPSGLLVPVIRDVQASTIPSIAAEIRRLGALAREGKLQSTDFDGATFTISNIGSIGGGVVAPIIVEPQVAIVGVGRSRIVPAFDDHMQVVSREELVLSFSADHRVLDGAECARAAERVKGYLERPHSWLLELA